MRKGREGKGVGCIRTLASVSGAVQFMGMVAVVSFALSGGLGLGSTGVGLALIGDLCCRVGLVI